MIKMFKFFLIYLIYRFHININIKKKIISTIADMKIKIEKNQSIYNEDNFYSHLKSFKKLKKVVFSVLIGEYDIISQFNLQKDFDFYLFTDEQSGKYNHTNWTIIPIPEEVQKLNVSRVKKQRFIKLHPHLYFKDYDLSIYIDANFKIIDDLNNFLIRVLSPNYNIYIFEHPERNTIFNETFEVVRLQKEKESIANVIRERYKKEKFPDKNGLIESCLIIRKHNEKDSIYLMDKWYDEIKNYSHRDQLSFNYIMWKTGLKIKYIVKNFALQYFFQNITHLELIQYKY
jgi:hypothetical protein